MGGVLPTAASTRESRNLISHWHALHLASKLCPSRSTRFTGGTRPPGLYNAQQHVPYGCPQSPLPSRRASAARRLQLRCCLHTCTWCENRKHTARPRFLFPLNSVGCRVYDLMPPPAASRTAYPTSRRCEFGRPDAAHGIRAPRRPTSRCCRPTGTRSCRATA